MILSPFPYKMFAKDRIKDGYLFRMPNFCSKNVDNTTCKKFYRSINDKPGHYICPNGFGVDYIQLGNDSIIFTCLNIEQRSDRKKTQRNIGKREFLPRLTINEYERIKKIFTIRTLDNVNLMNLEKEKSRVDSEKELLENTLHEIRKLNNQLKGYASKLHYTLNCIRDKPDNIEKINLDITASATLMSIRLNTYDLEVNPDLNLNTIPKEIPIYKKIEKIYKCLSIEILKKRLSVKLEGNSYNLYMSSDVIEIAFFIVVENAIKYSPPDKTIEIIFKEQGDELLLTFKSLGYRPRENEMSSLTNRGYRGLGVKDNNELEGRGIGLHLFKIICETNKIEFDIRLGDENYYEDGYRFSPFLVEMKFKNMIIGVEHKYDDFNHIV